MGENRSGKSNFLDALRLVLDPSLPDSQRNLRAEDFWDGLGKPFAGNIISKGRQFDAVIIPGLTEGVIPGWTWNRRKYNYDPPTNQALTVARRLFYVGFTRARKTVHLIYFKG